MIANGNYEIEGDLESGSTARYFCNAGYTPQNPTEDRLLCVQVDDEGYWMGDTLRCRLSTGYGKSVTPQLLV